MFSKFFTFFLSAFIAHVFMGTASICLAQGNPWTTKAEMQIPRMQPGTCVVNGKIYSIGGYTSVDSCGIPATKKVEEYDPSTDTWTIKEEMPTARHGLSISAVDDKIYAIGGHPVLCEGELSTVEVYDPLTDTWDTTKTPMPTPRGGLSISVVNGKIYAIGGYNYSSNIALAVVEEYNPLTDTWISRAPMPTARTWLSTCAVDGKIYAFGGHGTYPPWVLLNTVEVYDPDTDTWEILNDMPIKLQSSSASTVAGLIYLFGGITSGGILDIVWQYNPILDTMIIITQMPLPRAGAHSSELNGAIYVIGGSPTMTIQPTTTVQVYNPHNDLLGLVENVNVDLSYAIPGVDSVLITTKINNPTGITLFAEIEAPDQIPVDSLQLFDDGNHNDGSAGDSLFANSWTVPPVEESNYYIDLQITRIDSDTVVNHLNNMALFTTIGPVVLDSISCIKTFTYYLVKSFVKNQSASTTITNASVKLICNDPWVLPITPDVRNLPDIPAGGAVSNSFAFTVRQIDSLFLGYFNFKVEVMSDGWAYWTDSTQLIITEVEEEEINEVPTEFLLSQNYPNPFNSTSVIKYSIPELSFITIQIYDVLGSEIARLVNEEKPAGTYELNWNAANLPSGVYFYRLQAGDFVEIKKMILLK